MLNTALELANCDKCEAFVFMCHVGGVRTIVDCAPLDGIEDVRRRLMMGRRVYRILPGRKLAVFAPMSTKGSGFLVDHWCTPGLAGAKPLPREDAPRPRQAPVTPSPALGRPSAPVSGSQGHTELSIMEATQDSSSSPRKAVKRATPRPTRCATCNVLVKHDTPDVWSIEYDGRLVYAQHVEC